MKQQSWQQWALIGLGMLCAGLLLLAPLGLIFQIALSEGINYFIQQIQDPDMMHAIGLTLLATLVSVPINAIFGIFLAWLVTHYDFIGRKLLITVIDIPYATSPVVAGLCYLVVYGVEGYFGEFLNDRDIQLMFAWPGILMVTIFVTSPFVAKTLIPLMQNQGNDEEQAALTLGATGWQIFWHVTLPKIKWALFYGIIITNARAVGEFGAVSVVSGAIRGQTVTLSLLVEQLNEDSKVVGAFTAAALLASMAILTLIAKGLLERKQHG